jgi:hypothetical protein
VRRTDVVQVFPNDDALLRLVTAVLFELRDEWIAFPRRYLPDGSMDQLYPAERPKALPRYPTPPTPPPDDRLHHEKGHDQWRRLMKKTRAVPRVVVTDKLRSYGTAHREV